jgi:hypothetical protein
MRYLNKKKRVTERMSLKYTDTDTDTDTDTHKCHQTKNLWKSVSLSHFLILLSLFRVLKWEQHVFERV